ncbi:MAG: hypothetical protein LUD16_12110 [Lachnospiraceae bacterium]|nr:hypothetical protein [Lachnospiraceae bacterium]
MEFNRCFGCMEEWSGDGICPHCGYDARLAAANPDPLRLPEGTVLAGRYVSGKIFGIDSTGNTYIGWDLNMERKAAIREYYPENLVFRKKENGRSLVLPNKGSERLYQEGMQKYIHDARTFTRFLRHPRIGGTRDVFLENNTSYVVMEYIERVKTRVNADDRVGATMRMMEADVPLEVMMEEKSQVKPVGDLLLQRLGKKDMSVDTMSQLAGLSRAGGYKLIRNQGNTTQDTLLRIAFVLEFSAEETQTLLKSGHCAQLTAARRRDRAIIYGLKNRLTLGEMDEVLENFDLPTLVPPGR